MLNPAPGRSRQPALAAVTDWLIPNEHEFAIIAARRRPVRRGGGPGRAGRLAPKGSACACWSRSASAARRSWARTARSGACPRPPSRRVDTTGAGDAFVGAFVFGLASGWTEAAAARLGCAIAAESVLRPGTQRSFPETARCREVIDAVASEA